MLLKSTVCQFVVLKIQNFQLKWSHTQTGSPKRGQTRKADYKNEEDDRKNGNGDGRSDAFGTMGTGVTAMAAEDGDVVTIKFMHKGPKPDNWDAVYAKYEEEYMDEVWRSTGHHMG